MEEAVVEVVSAECYCCRLTEECTPGYVRGVKERYGGRWICGLCGEAVKEEMKRCGFEEALRNHVSFCANFRASSALTNDRLIAAFRQLLRRRRLKAVVPASDGTFPSLPGLETK